MPAPVEPSMVGAIEVAAVVIAGVAVMMNSSVGMCLKVREITAIG